jgi:uncharacterized protein (TIGR02594 family)
VGTAALFKVIARSGLHLRSGPGANFQIIETIANGTIIRVREHDGDWVKADLEGDGQVDGYMFAKFLEPVSGGLPVPPPTIIRRPIDVAFAEMELNVREVPGPPDNPRIVMYHATTRGEAAGDETAWCSSFVNFCVHQAGFQGTDNRWAKSWQGWHQDVTGAPAEGDIVVFDRRPLRGEPGGHVGFFISQGENNIQVLGGNQGNRIRIAPYPNYCIVDFAVGIMRVMTIAERSRQLGTRGAILVFQ